MNSRDRLEYTKFDEDVLGSFRDAFGREPEYPDEDIKAEKESPTLNSKIACLLHAIADLIEYKI